MWWKSVKPRSRYCDFSIFQDGGRRHLGLSKFQIVNGRRLKEGRTASPCQIWSKSVGLLPRYGDFFNFFSPSWICCVGVWATHEGRLMVLAWACEEKKDSTGQDRKKVTKWLYFTYLGRSPNLSDLHQKLCSRWLCRHNHVCQVSKWNFQVLPFYRGSNFPFCYWFLNGPYNGAALLRCLWYFIFLLTELIL